MDQAAATQPHDAVAKLVTHVRGELGKIIVGQKRAIDGCVLALLVGGHALMEGVPGVAKTLIVKTIAKTLKLDFQRVQCTSDLMPADILGTTILNAATGEFSLHRGPIFTDLLLVDEINRMPPRTQAALLEAMEERQVTMDGKRHEMSECFTVFATQNPVEFEGTYPLPEAQLDRFALKIEITYPVLEEEVQVLANHHAGFDARDLERYQFESIEPSMLNAARQQVKAVQVEGALFHYLTQLVRKTRDWPSISLGASPRAAVTLLIASKAMAAIEGRSFLIPDDIKSAAGPVLSHRILLKPEAELEGLAVSQVVRDVVKAVEVPR